MSSRQILLVGSEPHVLEGLHDVLHGEYRVVRATSGQEALALLRDQPVQLVLTDHPLTDMGGVDLLRRIRRENPLVSRLLFSSYPDAAVASALTGHGTVFRYLPRPWDADELLLILRQAVGNEGSDAQGQPSSAARRSRLEKWQGAAVDLRPGARLGEYQILGRLAQGGMGVVYQAKHTLLKRVVALKVLPQEYTADARAIARFRKEMRAVGRLSHPHIVQASDARKVKGVHFLVMEFVEGTDLARVVVRLGPLPVADACEVVRQAALGLQHAYEHGLVHRDVKPANLILTRAGQVKVLDLGLALLGSEPLAAGETIADSVVVGTADYMAPEQIMKPGAVDTCADVYGLGCTLYHLLAGHPPFSGLRYQTAAQKLRAHVESPVPSIRRVRQGIPAKLAAVLVRLLAKEPADRPGTPAQVATALEPFVAGSDLTNLLTAEGWRQRTDIERASRAVEPTEDYRG